ncbi:MAG: TolC family protein [Mangrovibacterium sp.]
MMKKLFMVLLALTCSGGAFAQQLSLDSCRVWAERNYPMIKQYTLIEKSKEFNLSNANKAHLPQVSFSAMGGYILSNLITDDKLRFIGMGTLNQTIWDGGATKVNKSVIAASAASDKANVDVAMYQIRSQVNQIFFGILTLDEQLKQLKVHRSVLENNEKQISQMNEQGYVYKTDMQEVQVELLKLAQQRTELEYTRTGYLKMLSYMIGADIATDTQLAVPEVIDVSGQTEINRPELQLYNSQRSILESQDKMRKVNLMPKFGLMATGFYMAPGFDLGMKSMNGMGLVSLSANWDISGLYKNANEKQLTELKLLQVDLQQETFEFNTNMEVIQSKANIAKQQSVLFADDKIVALRSDIRKGYQVKYDNGICTVVELLDATDRESEAVCDRALHKMELLMTQYELQSQLGVEQ